MEVIEIIKKIYDKDYTRVYNKTEFDRNLVGSEGYGETGYESFEAIIENFGGFFSQSAVFYDLGSGLGKIVAHVCLKCDVKKSCGIEYSKERHQFSLRMIEDFQIKKDNIAFINENILNCNLSDATVIYTDNTLFPDRINSEIYKKIPKNCLVLSRKLFKESRINNEMIKSGFSMPTNYGTNSLYSFIKK